MLQECWNCATEYNLASTKGMCPACHRPHPTEYRGKRAIANTLQEERREEKREIALKLSYKQLEEIRRSNSRNK